MYKSHIPPHESFPLTDEPSPYLLLCWRSCYLCPELRTNHPFDLLRLSWKGAYIYIFPPEVSSSLIHYTITQTQHITASQSHRSTRLGPQPVQSIYPTATLPASLSDSFNNETHTPLPLLPPHPAHHPLHCPRRKCLIQHRPTRNYGGTSPCTPSSDSAYGVEPVAGE